VLLLCLAASNVRQSGMVSFRCSQDQDQAPEGVYAQRSRFNVVHEHYPSSAYPGPGMATLGHQFRRADWAAGRRKRQSASTGEMVLSTQNGHSSLSSLQAPGYSLATMPRTIGFLALAACFILAGAVLDGGYQRSTPGSLQAQGTIVDFERRHSRQVYPVFEFKDADGMPHRVVNSTQQVIARFSRGDSVPIAYSRIDPERARIDTLWFNHRWIIGGIIVGLAIVIRALAGGDLKQN
jgi:hypothetical protein